MRFYDRAEDATATTLVSAPRYYVDSRLGRTQSLTPEGYLLVEGAPIARTGTMIYAPGEVPVEPGPDGFILIEREPDEVFRPETIASFEGKPIVDDHPTKDVGPDNWRSLSVGTMLNVRRGTGLDDDLLLADLLITDKDAIQAVREKKRDLSCGYDADYEQTQPGRGKQKNIIGNHVALVEHGRCGPRCKIGDSEMPKKRISLKDRLLAGFHARDEEAVKKALDEAGVGDEVLEEGDDGDKHQHIHVHLGNDRPDTKDQEEGEEGEGNGDLETRVAALEAGMEEIKSLLQGMANGDSARDRRARDEGEGEGERPKNVTEQNTPEIDDTGAMDPNPDATGDRRGVKDRRGARDQRQRARDSSHLTEEFRLVAANAEILVPGVRLPTFDAASDEKRTLDTLCAFRKEILTAADKTEEGAAAIATVIGKGTHDFQSMACDASRLVFNAAAGIRKQSNNSTIFRGSSTRDDGRSRDAGLTTIAAINARNKQFYGIDDRR